VAEVVRHLQYDVVNEIEHDHFEEVMLFEGFGENDLVGDVVFKTLELDHFLLAGEHVLLGA